MQVAYLTKPSNLFHVLRRQMNRQFRKRKQHDAALDVTDNASLDSALQQELAAPPKSSLRPERVCR
jgi:2-oxoglutarate dehydrogenase complex dehydrogenase (E1) component-like enzyme